MLTDPCDKCKRTQCPEVCYPKLDHFRALEKRNRQPCYRCPDRKPGCHGRCEKYIAWKQLHDEENRRKAAAREASEYEGYKNLQISKYRSTTRKDKNGKIH